MAHGSKGEHVKRFISQHLSGEWDRGCGERFDFQLHSSISRWNSIGNFTGGRTDDSFEEGEKHEFDVTTSCSFPLTKLDGRFKFTRPRIFRASISIILVWSIMKLLGHPLQREKFRTGWNESLCLACNERKRNRIWIVRDLPRLLFD